MANSDKSNLSAALDEAGDKILLLEGFIGERDSKLSELLEEISELRDSNSWLAKELESMICLNERLAQSEKDLEAQGGGVGVGQTKRSQLIESLRQLRLKSRIRQRASERLMERRRELANNGSGASSADKKREKRTTSNTRVKRKPGSSLFDEIERPNSAGENTEDDDDDDDDDGDDELGMELDSAGESKFLSEELVSELFSMLKQLQLSLQQRKETFSIHTNSQKQLFSPNSTDDSGISADDCKCFFQFN